MIVPFWNTSMRFTQTTQHLKSCKRNTPMAASKTLPRVDKGIDVPIYPPMRLVAQKDEWGCGVACVASILRISYNTARKLLVQVKGEDIEHAPEGLLLHHLALALQMRQFHVVADWDKPRRYKIGTIVLVGVEGGTVDQEHYMARAENCWMDPWINIDSPGGIRRAGYRNDLPVGKTFFVALIPKRGNLAA
jgi:hypothetical protein